MLQKQQARERGEETDSDDDEEYDEVVADIEWGDLGGEDALTSAHSLMRGPFPFHAREGEAVRPEEEASQTIGPSFASSRVGGSTTVPEVPAGAGRPITMPQELVGAGRSTIVPVVSVGAGGSATVPTVSAGAGGSTAAPTVPRERGGFAAMPPDMKETSPSAREQGMGSKRSCTNEVEQGTRGSSPKRLHRPTAPT